MYEPADDTFLLLDALEVDVLRSWNALQKERIEIGEGKGVMEVRTLELGVGSGVNTVKIGQLLQPCLSLDSTSPVANVSCYATDINPDAITIAEGTMKANGFGNVLVNDGEEVKTEGCSASPNQPIFTLKLIDLCGAPGAKPELNKDIGRWYGEEGFDFLIFNPPYVPTPQDEVGIFNDQNCSGIEASWAGGEDGRYVIDRALPEIARVMRKGGVVYMITVDENRPEEVLGVMESLGFKGEVFVRRQARNEFLSVLRMVKM